MQATESGIPSLDGMPVEVVQRIASCLGRTKHVSDLCKTSRAMSFKLQYVLYRHEQNSANQALHYACSLGNLHTVEAALKHNAAVDNCVTPMRETPLHVAARQGHVDIVKKLIAKGADVENRFSQDGGTPVCVAARFGHFSTACALVEHGNARYNARNYYGETPFHNFAERLDMRGAQFFYDVEQNHLASLSDAERAVAERCVNTRSNDGRTPLLAAVRQGERSVPMVAFLLRCGANLYVESVEGHAAFAYAAKCGYLNVVKALVAHNMIIVAAKDSAGKTILHHAAENGHIDVVRFLLQVGANVAVNDSRGWSPLDYAVRMAFLDIEGAMLGCAGLKSPYERAKDVGVLV